mmetsp:Transcript_2916/g.6996  ORF Transcript_2916/g.6996 Transcript_2916/m.6996 type:complete len:390 (-) Transcript_2916:532-1701(-)
MTLSSSFTASFNCVRKMSFCGSSCSCGSTRAANAPAAWTAAAGLSCPLESIVTSFCTVSVSANSDLKVSSCCSSSSSTASPALTKVCSVKAAEAWPHSSPSSSNSTTFSTPPASRTACNAPGGSSSSSLNTALSSQATSESISVRMVAMAACFLAQSSLSSRTPTTALAASEMPSRPRPTSAFVAFWALTEFSVVWSRSQPRACNAASSAGGKARVAVATILSTTPGLLTMASFASCDVCSSSSINCRTPTASSTSPVFSWRHSVTSNSLGSRNGSEKTLCLASPPARASCDIAPNAELLTRSRSLPSMPTIGAVMSSRITVSSRCGCCWGLLVDTTCLRTSAAAICDSGLDSCESSPTKGATPSCSTTALTAAAGRCAGPPHGFWEGW